MSLKSKLGHVVSCLLLVMSSNAANAATVYSSTWYMSDGTTGDVYYIDASDEAYQSGLYFDLVGNSAVDPLDFHGTSYIDLAADDSFDIVVIAEYGHVVSQLTATTIRIDTIFGPNNQWLTISPPSEAYCGPSECQFDYQIQSPLLNQNDYVQYDATYTLVSEVPVPAAAWLFGSGLLGLIGVARRKKA